MMNKDMQNTRFTTRILLNPDVQKVISSLFFSNFRIVKIEAIKNEKGINFVNIFGIIKKE